MLAARKTFEETLADGGIALMQRRRLGRVRDAVFAELDKAKVV